jgi:hypothetical protein
MTPDTTSAAAPDGSGKHHKRLTSDFPDNRLPAQEYQTPSLRAASLCFCGIDPGLSGAIAFFFPVAPDRVAAEDMPAAGGEVDCATLAARIIQMGPALAVPTLGTIQGQMCNLWLSQKLHIGY